MEQEKTQVTVKINAVVLGEMDKEAAKMIPELTRGQFIEHLYIEHLNGAEAKK